MKVADLILCTEYNIQFCNLSHKESASMSYWLITVHQTSQYKMFFLLKKYR